jgi:hypothetical protein
MQNSPYTRGATVSSNAYELNTHPTRLGWFKPVTTAERHNRAALWQRSGKPLSLTIAPQSLAAVTILAEQCDAQPEEERGRA